MFGAFVSLVLVIISVSEISAQNASLTIPLNKTLTLMDRELYGEFVTLNSSSTLQVDFSSVNKNISFIIFQVHSHVLNVTLYNNTDVKGSTVIGTNVGLHSSAVKLDTFFVFNGNEDGVTLYLSVHGYGVNDPIPGGCNMELPIPISPFLQTTYNRDYIMVDAASPAINSDPNCNSVKDATLYFYIMYLPERDFSPDTYFRGLRSMMSLSGVMANGDVVPETGVMWSTRRMLSAYPGTGAIFVVVAMSSEGYSIYVPSYTYACQPLDANDGCVVLDDFLSQLMCAALMFAGAFVCYFGHRFFKTEMFFVGMASGALVTYILIDIIANLDRPALVGVSILSGALFGAIWLLFWYFYGIPFVAVMLSTLNAGFLVAAIVYFSLPGGVQVLEVDFNFWTAFVFIMLLTSVILISVTFISNILCCCFLGAYAIIFPIDHYIGSNLKYIMINTIRRATVAKFSNAVLAPPLMFNDTLLIFAWQGLAVTGLLYQLYSSRGRPPFPPPPRAVSTWIANDPYMSHLPHMQHNPPRYYGAVSRNANGLTNPVLSTPTIAEESTPLLA